jgi:hypothetical protein
MPCHEQLLVVRADRSDPLVEQDVTAGRVEGAGEAPIGPELITQRARI